MYAGQFGSQSIVEPNLSHRPALTPLVVKGLFDDEAIICALTKFSTDPEISVVLAQAVLHIWAANEGVRSPTALDIDM